MGRPRKRAGRRFWGESAPHGFLPATEAEPGAKRSGATGYPLNTTNNQRQVQPVPLFNETGRKRSGATGPVEYHKQAATTGTAVPCYSTNPVAPLRFAPGSAFQFLIDSKIGRAHV